jgi:CMP-N-acetylneuraminic acid synthetase
MILAVILARGGSKRLPNKNILPMNGKPLIAYAIQTAKTCKFIQDVIVSTDSEEIQFIANQYGGNASFLRPKQLATDTASSYDAIKHALSFYEAKEKKEVRYIVLLQPTSPLTKVTTIEKTIHCLDKGYEYALTVTKVSKRFEWIGEIDQSLFVPFLDKDESQNYQLKTQFVPSGNVYAMTRAALFKDIQALPKAAVEVDMEEAIDIDFSLEFEFAEFLLKKKHRAPHE